MPIQTSRTGICFVPARDYAAVDIVRRDLIARHGASLCPLPEHHALTDLDTPQAWADWRARTGLLE